MAITVPAHSIIQVVLSYQVDGQTCLNALYYQTNVESGDWYEEVEDPILTFVDNNILTKLKACQSTLCVKHKVTIQPVHPTRIRSGYQLSGGGGIVTGGMLPSTTSVVISKYNYEASKKGMGRIFVGGVPSVWNNKSELADAGYAPFDSLANELSSVLDVAGLELQPVIVNLAGTPGDPKNVDVCVTQPVLRVQRRREVGRGI